MKVLKGMVLAFLNLLLFSLVFSFIVSFSIRPLFVDSLVKNIVKEEISLEMSETLEIEEETVSKILEVEEVDQFFDMYIDKTIAGLADEEALNDLSIGKDIIKYIEDNESELEEQFGVDIPIDKINEVVTEEELQVIDEQYKNVINEARETMPAYQKSFVRLYGFLISTKLKIAVGVIIAVVVLLIAVVQKSFYKWLKDLSISAIISGIFVMIMGAFVSWIVNAAITEMNVDFVFDVKSLYVGGGIACLSGTIMIIIYMIVKKLAKKREEVKDEISEVSV